MESRPKISVLLLAAPGLALVLTTLRAQVPLDPFISNNATCPVILPGNYILTNDVEWSSTNTNATAPLAIVTNGVSLNLNGKTIRAIGSSTNTNNDIGIFVAGPGISNIAVSNGVIEGFTGFSSMACKVLFSRT